ncbi:UPF0146 family protein [Halosimplex aquaticum]|uniref:UPF0146 protein ACFQMA_11555 n=1 Tax=Halosimplex aquaticum TaxID=3026162 RepID=A0ABD5Y4R4_9EURY|nr:UPF0146 family protein [Halosimplex aquaticum]
MIPETLDALVDRFAAYDAAVEVGIGRRTVVAEALVDAGTDVVATDRRTRPVPESVRFVRDDVTDPDYSVYADADLLYALNLPPELHRPTLAVAREAGATFAFTTLGTDQPLVAVDRETLPAETLFVARG